MQKLIKLDWARTILECVLGYGLNVVNLFLIIIN